MAEHTPENLRDWSAEERIDLALRILGGEISTDEAARRYGLSEAGVNELKATFAQAADKVLGSHFPGEDALTREGKTCHGDGVGVWVCAMSKQSLAPCLFIQSVCGDCFPLEASAQWNRAGRPPRPARRSGTLTLVHGKSGEGPCQENRVHLFSARVADTIAIERRTVLADWRFPTRIDGAVVVLDRNDADDGAHRLFRAFRPEVNRTLLWMKAQDLPFVVAAVGYEGGGLARDALHEQLDVASEVPIVCGPSLARVPPSAPGLPGSRGDAERGIIASLPGRVSFQFDQAYAKQVLGVLCNAIEARRETRCGPSS